MKVLCAPLLALLLLPALTGCDSEGDDGNGGDNGNDGSITATVDGANFVPDSVNPTFEGGVLQVTGIRGTTDQLTFSIAGAAVGTFMVAPTSQVMIMYREGTTVYQANGATVLGGASGTLTIQSLSDTGAQGTFSGTLFNITAGSGTIPVSNGQFDVSF